MILYSSLINRVVEGPVAGFQWALGCIPCRLLARRASWDAPRTKNVCLWTPKFWGKREIIFNYFPKYIKFIWNEIASIFIIIIHLTFWSIWWCNRIAVQNHELSSQFRTSLEQILTWSNVNFKGFPEERSLAPPPPLTVDISLYQNWTPSFRTLAKSLIPCKW